MFWFYLLWVELRYSINLYNSFSSTGQNKESNSNKHNVHNAIIVYITSWTKEYSDRQTDSQHTLTLIIILCLFHKQGMLQTFEKTFLTQNVKIVALSYRYLRIYFLSPKIFSHETQNSLNFVPSSGLLIGNLNVLAFVCGIIFVMFAAIILISFVYYSRHRARYYTHEEKRGGKLECFKCFCFV